MSTTNNGVSRFVDAHHIAWVWTPDEIQADLDCFMAYYNFERTHQGYRVAGRTPARALLDGLGITRFPLLAAQQAEEVPAA